MAERTEQEALAAPPAPSAGGAERGARRWLAPGALYLVLQSVQVVVLHELAPRFFWLDDSQRQFGPMAWWMGRNLRDGRPPVMDPDLGMAGNLVADMQYGALDPLQWVFQSVAGRFDNLVLLSWAYTSVLTALLGAGTLWLLLHYRVRPVLAVAGALGVASSGFYMWYGGSWWPLMWSTAWLPLLWAGLASRRWPGAIVAGVATWALLTSGNPYAVPFGVLIVAGQVWENLRERGSVRSLVNARLVSRLVACTGGVIVALPTLLTALQLVPIMGRGLPDPEVGNSGFAVANLADVVLGGMTLMGQTNTWNGNIGKAPALATLLVALPLLALVRWERAIRASGVLTAAVLYLAAVVFTQLPSQILVFRSPVRYLVAVQVALPLLALIAFTAAPDLSRRRLRVVGLILGAQLVLSLFRAPVFFRWHLLAAVVTAAAFAATVMVARNRPSWPLAPSVVLLAAVFASLLVGEQMMVSVQERFDDINSLPESGSRPFRVLTPGYAPGGTVQEYRENAYATDTHLTAIVQGNFGDDMGLSTGITAGNTNLIAGLKPGFGSLAVAQAELGEHWCRLYEGDTCSSPAELLATVPGTSMPWVDVLSSDRVVLEQPAEPEIARHFETEWERHSEREGWVEYRREDGLPGRITVARGVEVSTSDWTAGLAYAGEPMDVYSVSTGGFPGSLIFRTPYWPGFRATLDGASLAVSSVDQSVLKIDLPPGLSGAELEIFYEPIGVTISLAATMAGIVVILASGAGQAAWSRRRRAGFPHSAGDRAAA